MAKKILYFEELDTTSLEDYHDVSIPFGEGEIVIDLNFEKEKTSDAKVEVINNFLQKITAWDIQNKDYLEDDLRNGDGENVKFYLDHHLEELEQEELETLIDLDDMSLSKEEQLFKKLELVRIGLYPDSEAEFAIFDYSIGEEITDYLVVVNTDVNGQLDFITMES